VRSFGILAGVVVLLVGGWVAGCEEAERVVPECGNSVKDGSEMCDGEDLGGSSCTDVPGGFTGGSLACTSQCIFDTTACTMPVGCGDRVIGSEEQCEPTDLGGASCVSVGNFVGGVLRCGADCRYDTRGCEASTTCGNGAINPGETCDGTNLNDKACTTVPGSFTGGTLTCGPLCLLDTSGCTSDPVCGNGAIDGGETCDGSELGGQSCTSVPGGFTGGTLGCTGSCAWDTSGCTS
jgi:hypothetical protein